VQGRVISDRYRLIRLVGKGGMGSVWLAEHTTLRSEVAVKLIDSELGRLPQPRARFLREAQLAARIKSAHVVQVHDHGVTAEGQPYIAMEYLVGCSLRERMHERGRLSLQETARMVTHVCRALTGAHEAGLVHRDLKPENIFLARDADDEIVKVLDFGVAKATDALSNSGVDPTRTGALLGTPFYMSPEQAQGLKTVDHRSDLWSLGVVVFECITGLLPFSAPALGPLIGKILSAPIPSPSLAAPDARFPPEIDAWMARALARDPAARFASARELCESFLIAAGATDSLQRGDAGRDSTVAPFGRTEPGRQALGNSAPVVRPTAMGATLPLVGPASAAFAGQGPARSQRADPNKNEAPASAPAVSVDRPPASALARASWIVAAVILAALAGGLAVFLALRR
jgi:serine/threonine-protein kinase